jgi:putative transcription antitermination factor YqgF
VNDDHVADADGGDEVGGVFADDDVVVGVEEDAERAGRGVVVVVGLPLNMDGSSGPAARSAVAWGQSLAARSGKPVVFVDERLSSFDAEQQLIDRKRAGEKLTRQRKKEQLDAIAAAAFLQDFLDGKLNSIDA